MHVTHNYGLSKMELEQARMSKVILFGILF